MEGRTAETNRAENVEITVEGENVGEGEIDLAALALFANGLQKAMRAVAAGVRQRPSRGRPAKSVERATGLRLIGIRAGSTTLLLRSTAEDQFGGIAEDTLNELERVVGTTGPVDEAVVTALEEARRGLGTSGRFAIRRASRPAPLVFDQNRLEVLRRRALQAPEVVEPRGLVTVTGWLHMVDLAPDEVVISSPEGVEWRATYPADLEPVVRSAVGSIVVASGHGNRTGPTTGRLELGDLSQAPQLTLGRTFLVDGLAGENDLEQLMLQQGISAPQTVRRPAGLNDADIEGFLKALSRLHESP